MKRYIPLIILLGITASYLSAALISPTAFYLLHPRSALSAGIGEVGTGLVSQYYASSYNPAVRARERGLFGNISYSSHFQGINNNSLMLHWNRGNYAFGCNVLLSNISDIEAREKATEEPDYIFTSHHFAINFIGNYTVKEIFNIGVAYKRLFERIDYSDMSGYAVDLGLTATYGNLSLGVSVLNWGEKVKFVQYFFALPTQYRAGVSYVESPDKWGLGVDVVKPDYSDFEGNIGGWWRPLTWAKLNAGYIYGRDTQTLTFGGAVSKDWLAINYTARPLTHKLGWSHLFSLSFALSTEH